MDMLHNLFKKVKNQRGVTLIELLAVIIILGIIAAIGVPAILNSKKDAETSKGQANASIISEAAHRHIFDTQIYSAGSAPTTGQFNMASILTESNIVVPPGGSVTEGSTAGDATTPDPVETATFNDGTGTYTLHIDTGNCTYAHN